MPISVNGSKGPAISKEILARKNEENTDSKKPGRPHAGQNVSFEQRGRRGDGETGCFPKAEILKPLGFRERESATEMVEAVKVVYYRLYLNSKEQRY